MSQRTGLKRSSTLLHAANNVALMDMIMEYLDHEGQKSPTFALPVQPLGPHVKIWAESLPEFDASPISNPPPSYKETEFSDSTERSFSPMGSMFSDTSSYEEEEGYRTPPTPIDPLRSSLVYSNDVKYPETPSSALPEALIVIPKSIYHSKRESPLSPLSPISRTPIEPIMQATITNLVDIMPECMEEFIPEASPVKRSSTNRKPVARLSLKRKPVARLQIQIPTTSVSPIEEVTPTPQPRPSSAAIPPRHVGELLITYEDRKVPKPVRHSTPVPVLGKKLLRNLEIEARNSAPVRSPIVSLSPVVSRTKQQQIEKIPPPKTETKSQDDEAVAFGTNMGIWFTKGFFAGGAGLTLTMSRRYLTYSKMEWVVENEDGSGLLKCYSQMNSLSRRTDFRDMDGSQIFQFQKRTGSTRMAESPMGATLFAVKNASLYSLPHWTVSLTGASESSTAQWIAKGDEAMENVIVNWGGFCVGRISCPSKLRKHFYTVNIAPEMNYAIIAALTTVFDDLRVDKGV